MRLLDKINSIGNTKREQNKIAFCILKDFEEFNSLPNKEKLKAFKCLLNTQASVAIGYINAVASNFGIVIDNILLDVDSIIDKITAKDIRKLLRDSYPWQLSYIKKTPKVCKAIKAKYNIYLVGSPTKTKPELEFWLNSKE